MRMLGKSFRMCPWGKRCSCNPPGMREAAKKAQKRREKQQWKREIGG
ncbi:hypothetical protein SEA_FORREST_246 [Streptomyces phage Forrest]|nr:hypothetical protein SEA_FORREST_246 [Streptomyces phage Forrest]QZE11578.1 hypothetical protein SEA_JADA_245 [Streptomyces phage Jada]